MFLAAADPALRKTNTRGPANTSVAGVTALRLRLVRVGVLASSVETAESISCDSAPLGTALWQ